MVNVEPCYSYISSIVVARMGRLDRGRTTLSQNTSVKWQLDTAVFRMLRVENRRPILLEKRHTILFLTGDDASAFSFFIEDKCRCLWVTATTYHQVDCVLVCYSIL
ncbi:unnamed protein product [Parnassius mnemosyne]|uniref:Uncharacterized protein n=1 Tax=Parnassius mnemosyne TaxID=213953 RepID=A0AAV1KHC8_9NEOP